MLENIHFYDVLRSDKTISSAGLEARVPFGGKDFMKYVMSLHPKHKMFNKEILGWGYIFCVKIPIKRPIRIKKIPFLLKII